MLVLESELSSLRVVKQELLNPELSLWPSVVVLTNAMATVERDGESAHGSEGIRGKTFSFDFRLGEQACQWPTHRGNEREVRAGF